MGLLSDLNWKGAAAGAGKALAQVGQMGVADTFARERADYLADKEAARRQSEKADDRRYESEVRAEDRAYKKGLLTDERAYQDRRDETEHTRAMMRDESKHLMDMDETEQAARLKTPEKLETVELNDKGEAVMRTRTYQSGQLKDDNSVPVSEYLTAKNSKSGTGSTATDWTPMKVQKFYADKAATMFKAPDNSDDADLFEDLRAKQSRLADVSGQILNHYVATTPLTLQTIDHNNVAELARQVVEGETALESIIPPEPAQPGQPGSKPWERDWNQ